MRIIDDLRSGLTPAVEELHQSWDKGRPEPLRGRELAAEAVTAAAFLAVATLMAVLVPAERAFDAPLAATLVATYAVMARVRFPIGYGFTIPTQLVLVPMLFLVPLGEVPLLVAAGMVLGGLPEYLRGDRHPTRALAAIGDSWHAVGPVAVLAAAGVAAPELGDWPVLLAALVAQVVVDNGVATLREMRVDDAAAYTPGQTLTVTSPRWAFLRSSIWVRDWPMPPPIDSGRVPSTIPR